MPTYAYVAHSRDGKKQSGTLTAESRQSVTQQLTQRGLTPDQIQERVSRGGVGFGKGGPRVKTVEILLFTRQLSTIVNAGLPLLQGLDILGEQTEDQRFARVIQQVGQDVESGETFSDSLRRHPRVFSDLFVSMVRAGEAGGDLDGVLLQLADYLEATEDLKRRIKSAMTYPVVAFSMIMLIAVGLIAFVVPQFVKIYASFPGGADKLPVPTKILLHVSNAMWHWEMLVIIAVVVVVIILLRIYGQTPAGRLLFDRVKLRLPIFGKLLRKVAISRFSRTLSTLTRSGVAILAALEIVERTSGNEVFARAIHAASDSVRGGETLADPLARSEEFPGMVTRMIGVGEKTGALETMLTKISDFYDSEVKATVDALTSMIEPLLILVMGIIVGSIVIALFLPIMNLSKLVQP